MEDLDKMEKATYLRIAMAMQNISVPQIIAEQLLETFEAINQKGGDFSVHDAIAIQIKNEEKKKKLEEEKYEQA